MTTAWSPTHHLSSTTQTATSARHATFAEQGFEPESSLQLVDRIQEAMTDVRMLMLSGYAGTPPRFAPTSIRMRRPLKLLTKPCRPPDNLLRVTHALLQAPDHLQALATTRQTFWTGMSHVH